MKKLLLILSLLTIGVSYAELLPFPDSHFHINDNFCGTDMGITPNMMGPPIPITYAPDPGPFPGFWF